MFERMLWGRAAGCVCVGFRGSVRGRGPELSVFARKSPRKSSVPRKAILYKQSTLLKETDVVQPGFQKRG